jgi:hypothetical protein
MKSLLKKNVKKIGKLLGLRPQHRRAFLLKYFPPGSVGAEIGVYKGDFSRRLLDDVKPEKLHLIDPWKYEDAEIYQNAWYGGHAEGQQSELDAIHESVLERFKDEIKRGQVEVHRSSSSDATRMFQNGYFDWIYIDGNHLYEFVKKDLEMYFNLVKAGGLITGDDYHTEGWWRGGVKKAVDEFLASHPVTLVTIRKGQFVLRKE